MTARQWLALAGLTCSAFVFNTSEFMPIGLLSSIAGGFGLTEAQAGMMTSIYAWAVMALSLPLMVFASRFEYKRLLLTVIALFTAGQFACAVAPTFELLVTARLLVACAHAIFWSIASVMATRAVAPEHGSLALSMVATGTSVAAKRLAASITSRILGERVMILGPFGEPEAPRAVSRFVSERI